MKRRLYDTKNSVTMRVDPSMKKLFNKIRIEKIKSGECVDIKELSDRRLSLALSKYPDIERILLTSKIRR